MLGDMDVTMSGHEAKRHYEVWLDRGVPTANHITSVMRLLFNYGIEMGYCDGNPFKAFKRQTSTPRKVVWHRSDVKKFLDVAYSEYKWRSLAIIAHTAYEWCQRVGDMRMLTWDSLNFHEGILNLEQSKRRAEVHLPIEGDLLDMLVQQRDDFGFQDYVAPVPTSDGQCYRPYSDWYLSKMSRVVMRVAGLSDNLRLSDLRRTGTIEMVEAGVPMGQIMAVTGHANPQSVKPYMKATYTAANAALTTRRSNVGLKD
jgi:integrase